MFGKGLFLCFLLSYFTQAVVFGLTTFTVLSGYQQRELLLLYIAGGSVGNEVLPCGSDCPGSTTVNGFQTSSGRLRYEFLACSGTFRTSESLAF